MITIIDYGLGNLLSIQNMLKQIGLKSLITEDLDIISNASNLILRKKKLIFLFLKH